MAKSLAFDIIARDRASAAFDKVGKSADGSSSRLKSFAKVGALAAAGAAVVAGKALFDMAKGAAEDEAAQKRLAVALKNNAGATKGQVGAVEDWITAQGKAKGIADDQLRPALGKLVAATHDVGKSQKLASLAMDVSAGSGKSLDSVTTALAKAQNGNVAGLAKLGVATKNADGSTRSLNDITKDLAKTYSGQASAAANTTEGKWKRLKLQWDEAKETIGAKLLPIGEKLADFLLNKMGPAAQKVGDWFQKNVIPPLKEFGERIAPKVREYMDKVRQAFKDAGPYLDLLGKVVKNVLIPALGWLAEHALAQAGRQVAILGKAFGALGRAGTWLWNNALQPAFKLILKGFGWLLGTWAKMLDALSHVPSFGWAKKASEAMAGAAEQAKRVANNIQGIKGKDVHVNVFYNKHGFPKGSTSNYDPSMGGLIPQASGTTFAPSGGSYLVGELGPERVTLPRGAQVDNAAMTRDSGGMDYTRLARAIVSALREGTPLVQLPDAGRGAYLMGG